MKSIYKKLLLLPLIASLSACGYQLKETYDGDAYVSPIFSKNVYRVYDEAIDINSDKYSVIDTKNIEITNEHKVVTHYKDAHILDKNIKTPSNPSGKLVYGESYKPNDSKVDVAFGPTYKMSRVDSSFSYGITSKLFDGQMECYGKFENARVQVDDVGFGKLFDKRITTQKEGAYFALQFKGMSMKDDRSAYPSGHDCDLTVHVTFYIKDAAKYHAIDTSYRISDFPVNHGSTGEEYRFYAFSLDNIDLTNCAGVSVRYSDFNDPVIENTDFKFGMMLYEMFFVNTIWR